MTPTWITMRDCSSIMKKANSERKKRSVTGRRVAGQDLLGMMAQKKLPVLPSWIGRAYRSHIFLDRAFADAQTQLEPFAPDPFRSQDADSALPFA